MRTVMFVWITGSYGTRSTTTTPLRLGKSTRSPSTAKAPACSPDHQPRSTCSAAKIASTPPARKNTSTTRDVVDGAALLILRGHQAEVGRPGGGTADEGERSRHQTVATSLVEHEGIVEAVAVLVGDQFDLRHDGPACDPACVEDDGARRRIGHEVAHVRRAAPAVVDFERVEHPFLIAVGIQVTDRHDVRCGRGPVANVRVGVDEVDLKRDGPGAQGPVREGPRDEREAERSDLVFCDDVDANLGHDRESLHDSVRGPVQQVAAEGPAQDLVANLAYAPLQVREPVPVDI